MTPSEELDAVVDLSYTEARQRVLLAFERRYAAALLERSLGNISEAARLAGMDRTNFKRVLRRVRRAEAGTLPRPVGRPRRRKGG